MFTCQYCGVCIQSLIFYSDVYLLTYSFVQVLKPTDSAGSDGVKLCHSIDEAKEHFQHLLTVEAVNGGFNTEVLCQEFLRGKEYVIDHVSRNGVHKTMAVWVYDKRPRNGSQFVYFGMWPIDPESEEAKMLIPYTRGVLDALGMKHGVSCIICICYQLCLSTLSYSKFSHTLIHSLLCLPCVCIQFFCRHVPSQVMVRLSLQMTVHV